MRMKLLSILIHKFMEQNTNLAGVKIHDVVVINKKCKENDDGSLRGHTFYQGDKYGVVISINDTIVTIKNPGGDIEKYNFDYVESDDYTYTIAPASEIAFIGLIADRCSEKDELAAAALTALEKNRMWGKEFRDSISLINKLKRLFN